MEVRMNKSDKIILVSGATGRQGGAVLRHLLKNNWPVRALTRNRQNPNSQALSKLGAEIAEGDMDRSETLEKAMNGAYGVFSVQDYWTTGAKREVQQGKNMADAAKKAGVQHLVYSSVGGAERNSGITHFETKFEIENYIRQLRIPATILRPVAFMENYYIPDVEKGILKGKLVDPIRGDKRLQLVAADDIGAFTARVFEKPELFSGQAIEIAGEELTNIDAAKTFSHVMGRPVRFKKLPMFIVKLFLGKEFYEMFRWFNDSGFKADIRSLRSQYPEIKFKSLEEWLRSEGWDKKTDYRRHTKTWDAKSPKIR